MIIIYAIGVTALLFGLVIGIGYTVGFAHKKITGPDIEGN